MMSSKNNGFTASDIERYHSGKMPAEERHALEKAALDDPFLADALEGYAFTSAPSDDLAKIQSRLDEKLERKKVIPLFQKYKWVSVAAIVLIIVGAGWLVYTISESQTKATNVAVEQMKDSSQSSNYLMPGQPLTIDSNKVASGVLQQSFQNNQTEANSVERNTLDKKSQKQLKKDKEVAQGKKEITQVVTTQATAQNEMMSDKSFFKAETKDVAKNNALVAEPKANNVSTPYARETATNNAPLTNKVRGIRTGDTIKNLNVVLQPLPNDSLSLQEVVVGYGAQKKSAITYPHVTIDTLEPAEGYVKFDDYIANNLKTPEEFKTKPVPGEVQLSFDVNENGQPVNIAVIKSLCDKCDEEAVRLLKEGPKWKKKKNKKGKITIKF